MSTKTQLLKEAKMLETKLANVNKQIAKAEKLRMQMLAGVITERKYKSRLNENIESKAISIIKEYEGIVDNLDSYIEYLENIPPNDDIYSAIQAIADDLNRDIEGENDLRVELESII
jgi:hypothetical protein